MLLISQPDFALRIASRYTVIAPGISTPAEMTLLALRQDAQEQSPRRAAYSATIQDIYNITNYLQHNTLLNLNLNLSFLGRILSAPVQGFSQVSTQITRMLEKNVVLRSTENRIEVDKTETVRAMQPLTALRRTAAIKAADTLPLLQAFFASSPGGTVFLPGDAEIIHIAKHVFEQNTAGGKAGSPLPGYGQGAELRFPPERSLPGAKGTAGAALSEIPPSPARALPGLPGQKNSSARGMEKPTPPQEAIQNTNTASRAYTPPLFPPDSGDFLWWRLTASSASFSKAALLSPEKPDALYRPWETAAVSQDTQQEALPYSRILGRRPAYIVYLARQGAAPENQPARETPQRGASSLVRTSPLYSISVLPGTSPSPILPASMAWEPGIQGGLPVVGAKPPASPANRLGLPAAPARNIPGISPSLSGIPHLPHPELEPSVFSGLRVPSVRMDTESPAIVRSFPPLYEPSPNLPPQARSGSQTLFPRLRSDQPAMPETPTPFVSGASLQYEGPQRQAADQSASPRFHVTGDVPQKQERALPADGPLRQATKEINKQNELPEYRPVSPTRNVSVRNVSDRSASVPLLEHPVLKPVPDTQNVSRADGAPTFPISREEGLPPLAAQMIPRQYRPPQIPGVPRQEPFGLSVSNAAFHHASARTRQAVLESITNMPGALPFTRHEANAPVPPVLPMVYAKAPGRTSAEEQAAPNNEPDIEFIGSGKRTIHTENNRLESKSSVTRTINASVDTASPGLPSPAELEKPVNEIADKVYQILERRLRSERMRKGLL